MAKKVMRGVIIFSTLFFTVLMIAFFIMDQYDNNYILKYQEQKGEYDYNKIIELRKTYIYMAQKRLEIGNLTEEEKDKERKLINVNSDYIKLSNGYWAGRNTYYNGNYSPIRLKLSEIYVDLFFIKTIVVPCLSHNL